MAANISQDIESRLGKLSYYSGHHELKELKNKIDSKLKDLKEQPVYVMIVGDGNRGKSTLLNALIGQNLAEVSHLPKTWRIDTYTMTKDEEYAELVWEDQGRERKEKTTYQQAFATCKEIEKKQKEISKKLEDWKSDLKQVNWYIKSKWNLSGRALVDTPGFSQLRADTSIKAQTIYNANGIQLQREDGFSYYYYRADLVLWCISATKLEDADALDKLKEVHTQNKQIIGIITFMDRIPRDRWEDIRKSAQSVYGSYISKFIFSAAGASDTEIKNQTVREIMAAVDEYTLGKEKYIKHIEAEKFYKHNLNELERLIKQIASLFTDNYIQYHNLLDSTLESLSIHETGARDKITSYLINKRDSLINSLDSLWSQCGEQPNIFAQEIKNRIPIKVCNGEFEKIYRQLTDNFYAVFRIAQSTDYKAVKLGQNKTIEIKLDNLNAGNLSLHDATTVNISKFDSLRGRAAGQGAIEFFGNNLVGEIFEGLGKALFSNKVRREKIGGAAGYINEIFDDLYTQYTEYIDNLSYEFSAKLKTYIYDKFKDVNGGNEKAVLNRIFDIENTLNNLNLYENNDVVLCGNNLIKSYYIPKIISKCKYYFNVHSKEIGDFLENQIKELQKHNKEKIREAFDKAVIDVEYEPIIFDFNKILNIPTDLKTTGKYSSSKRNYPLANLAAALTAVNNKDSFTKNIYWQENNLEDIDKLNLLTPDNYKKAEEDYMRALAANKDYFDNLYFDYASKWDSKVKGILEGKIIQYEDRLQLTKRYHVLKNSVDDCLRKEINYNNIESYFYFEPEKSYYEKLYETLDYSYFYNSRGQDYKFHQGTSAKDYLDSQWIVRVNSHRNNLIGLEGEYAKKLNQKIRDYADAKFNEYIKNIDVITDFEEDLKSFKLMCIDFVNGPLNFTGIEEYKDKCDRVFDKYYKSMDIDFSFFYPESSKKNIYFKYDNLNSHLRDKLEEIIHKQTHAIDDIHEETKAKWDLRVLNYTRDYYSGLIVKNIKSKKDIFDSREIKNNFFDTIKRQYTMDSYVLNIIDKSINFKSKLINAVSFEKILKENVIPQDLAFNLEIEKEIFESYKIFEENMLNYMTEMLLDISTSYFDERNSLKYMVFKGKNSVFVAENLNEQFKKYILSKGGALL